MKNKPTRRTFFSQAGAALAVPLAAAGTGAADGNREDATTRLEDMNAIRALLPTLLAKPARMALDASVRSVVAEGGDSIAFALDGTATARLDCTVEAAAPIETDGTLVEMARLQGDGFVLRSERRVLLTAFVKNDGRWQFKDARFEVKA
jgi:hypothetical protein